MSGTQGTARATQSQSRQTGRHGEPLRGLLSTASSDLAQGKFGRMFRSLLPAQFGADEATVTANLNALGKAMTAGIDAPKDGRDDEESGIPALYTYFGQFIDHDITFDPASSLQKQNDPNALIDYRTPALDLDNLYGRGPDDQPYLYTQQPANVLSKFFLEGNAMDGGGDPGAKDLPRNNADPKRALIGDPRNDENAIVSQLQALFLRFHNRTANDNPSLPFEEIQRLVRFHYQYVVLNDFLPKIVDAHVLSHLKSHDRYDSDKLKFFHWKHDPFMPVEFSVAAYRLGHSMVRPGYRLNDNDQTLLPIFPDNTVQGLGGFGERNPHWGIDWARFIDVEKRSYGGTTQDDKRRLQFAYKIDTSLVNPLQNVGSVVSDLPVSLAQRNLLRGWRMGLPSGQAVARKMNVTPLDDDQILIGKAISGETETPIVNISTAFTRNCPLWTYILAEARYHSESVSIPVSGSNPILVETPKLGPVGGRIVAEVLVGLMFGDRHSLLNLDPAWQPPSGANFGLREFVMYSLGQ